jgi:hypothetical protein
MPERRYAEDEIRAIFARAAHEQDHAQRRLDSSEGLTLAELTRIGEEAGLSPAFVARAARTLDRVDPAPPPTRYLGLPVGVRRTVRLDRPLSDADWERLVGDLRHTFDARGEERGSGGSREWRNGNLVCSVEPAGEGSRIHLRTRKGSAQGNISTAVAFCVAALVMTVIGLVQGEPVFWLPVLTFGLFGVGVLVSSVLDLPRWASTRERQMEGIVERLLERDEPGPPSLLDLEDVPAAAAPNGRVRVMG